MDLNEGEAGGGAWFCSWISLCIIASNTKLTHVLYCLLMQYLHPACNLELKDSMLRHQQQLEGREAGEEAG
jgi:hypothetical protein